MKTGIWLSLETELPTNGAKSESLIRRGPDTTEFNVNKT